MTKNIILFLFYTNLSIKSTPKRFQLAHLVIFFVNISHFYNILRIQIRFISIYFYRSTKGTYKSTYIGITITHSFKVIH